MGRTGGRINRLVNTKPDKGAPECSSSESDMAPEKETYKRVKPRLGSQYQTKVAKFDQHSRQTPHHCDFYCSERPPPDLMSIEHPHTSKQEAQRCIHDEHDAFMSSPPIKAARSQTSQRGGFCVHKVSSASDEYLLQAQYLMHPDLAQPPHSHADERWKQEMIRQNATGGRRGRKKRPHDSHTTCASWTTAASSTATVSERNNVMEDQECMYEYLQTRHDGKGSEAELCIRVHLQSGKASKARRCLRKELHDTRFKRPSFESSQSWRCRWERLFSTMHGDYREDATYIAYPHVDTAIHATLPDHDEELVIDDEDDGMRGVWRSVLSYGQEIERMLAGDGEPLELVQVVDFLRNAYSLPTAESSFGNRHLVVHSISECLNSIFDHLSKTRDFQAKVHDVLFDEANEGVDMDALRKIMDEGKQQCRIRMDDSNLLDQQIDATSKWQARLDALITLDGDVMDLDKNDSLKAAQDLAKEARTFGVRTRNLIQLEKRLEKAQELQRKLDTWRQSQKTGHKESVKYLAGLVRDAHKISLPSTEVWELLQFHREVEIWTDRANVAIRSRISLSEIELLIQRAVELPLDLSESVEKLNSRVRTAREWLDLLSHEVPCPMKEGKVDNIEWMARMRLALKDDAKGGTCSRLHDLASEGTRVSVEIDAVKMLQVELDAKSWSAKARKWLPLEMMANGNDDDDSVSKKGKLEDIREHLQKAEALRDKLVIAEKKEWALDFEDELRSIVTAADKWLDQYLVYLECDNRRSDTRSCLSIVTLKNIVLEGNSIHANIGTAITKLSRISAQADAWYLKYTSVIVRSGLSKEEESPFGLVTLVEMNEAVAAAAKDVSLDLEEALAIKDLAKRAQQWMDKVILAAPKRTKRKGIKNRFTIDDLLQLIEEAKALPIPTCDYIDRLNAQLDHVYAWRMKAQEELKDIAEGFESLRLGISGIYGQPEDFFRDGSNVLNVVSESPSTLANDVVLGSNIAPMDREPEGSSNGENASRAETESFSQTDLSIAGMDDVDLWSRVGGEGDSVFRLIEKLLCDARQTGICTPEEETAGQLEMISKWCLKSLKFLNSPGSIYDKKNYSIFDKFIVNGSELSSQHGIIKTTVDVDESSRMLRSRWAALVGDQLTRLTNLQIFRDKFISWSKEAQQILASKEKRPSIDELRQLACQSLEYPSGLEMVQRIRTLSDRANKWSAMATRSLDSDKKLTLQEAKELFDEGERLRISCEEVKVLRNAIRNARGWLNRVKRSKFDQGETSTSDVEELIDEHDSLDLALPDEVKKLKQAMKGYCICRRPYEGFMIGCDNCEEWYHGTCIGVSEAQAERFDKYLCARCSVEKSFKGSAQAVASIIRKWTSTKDLKKSRQNEYQKHQRRVRKEKKDIEKLEEELDIIRRTLASLDHTQTRSYENDMVSISALHNASGVSAEGKQLGGNFDTHLSKIGVSQLLKSTDQSKQNVSSSSLPATVAAIEHADGSTRGAECEIDDEKVTHTGEATGGDGEDEKNALIDQIEKISLAVKMCHERLGNLQSQAKERSELEREEDSCREAMRRWCVRVRSTILVPSTPDLAESGRPSTGGSMSPAMLNAFREAEYLGIAKLPDVHQVANSFRCLAWSALAMQTLAKKPSLKDVQSLVSRCHSLSLPDEKSVRMMKSMIQRTVQWQLRASKLLAPISGETRPFSMELLQNLQDTESEIPLEVPEMQIVSCSIQDKGKRHCLCGGPNDGTFMLGCDKCGRWFHGRCVDIPKRIGCRLEKWLCMPCEGKSDDSSRRPPTSAVDLESNDEEDSTCSIVNEIVPHAPVVSKLWPPFGRLGSSEAIAALGEECCMISDDIGPLIPLTKSSESVATFPIQFASPWEVQPRTDLSVVTTLSSNPLIARENGTLDLHPPIFQHHNFNGNNTWMAEPTHVPSVHSMPTENAFANQDVSATTIIMET